MATKKDLDEILLIAERIRAHEEEAARLKEKLAAMTGATVARAKVLTPQPTTRLPLPHRIFEMLDRSDRPMSTREIYEQLGGEDDIDLIHTTLSKLFKRGLIERADVGVYCSHAVFPERGRRPEGGG